MHLPRHTIESHATVPLFQHASFCSPDPASFRTSPTPDLASGSPSTRTDTAVLSQPAIFSCASLSGFMVSQTDPLKLVSNRTWSSSQGGLSHAVPVQHTSLLFLVGGGRVPRFAPNKVVLWDEAAEYTAKQPIDAAQGTGSDDDDDIDSASSRRASTIFSAGSQFDAYGKSKSTGSEDADDASQSSRRSSSSYNSLRFSTSSLVDADDEERRSNDPAGTGPRDIDAKKNSVEASSLGIGRLQASYLSEGSDSSDQQSRSFGPASASISMDSSNHVHSIMSSSANLADPFAEEQDTRSTALGLTSPKRTLAGLPSHPSQIGSTSTSPPSPPSEAPRPAKPALSPQSLFSKQATRQAGVGLVDSVSSLATTATNATATGRPKIMHGREVAELEFSEVVRGIYATSVHATKTRQDGSGQKGEGRASSEGANSLRLCVVLVVVLASKTVVFELSPPSSARSQHGGPASRAWRIHKRTSVLTYQNRKGLGSVAPYYEESVVGSPQQPSAIVAIPGRQKGHVQLLTIKLQSLTSTNAVPTLSDSASSVGAASIIVAHESSLAFIALSPTGHLLATASSKGTLIRIWSNSHSSTGAPGSHREARSQHGASTDAPGRTGFGARLTRELRRGTDPAAILSIAFAPGASLVAAASDKGTVHVFALADSLSLAGADAGGQRASSPSASSRAANLGRAAAQYLPSGLGNLASQIPPSVYPQYLKSEWSSAQFRIPLKSFGASSRHYTPPSTVEDSGMYGAGGSSAAPVGTEKSTEGAWAQMRSRISDIRKGEASVDESIFLCWIAEGRPSPSTGSSPPIDKSPSTTKDRSREAKARSRVSAQRPGQTPDNSAHFDQTQGPYHLIALTTSGGWYKLAVTLPKRDTGDTVSGSTVLDMYRRDASSRSKQVNALECRLVEYRPMAALLDGWKA